MPLRRLTAAYSSGSTMRSSVQLLGRPSCQPPAPPRVLRAAPRAALQQAAHPCPPQCSAAGPPSTTGALSSQRPAARRRGGPPAARRRRQPRRPHPRRRAAQRAAWRPGTWPPFGSAGSLPGPPAQRARGLPDGASQSEQGLAGTLEARGRCQALQHSERVACRTVTARVNRARLEPWKRGAAARPSSTASAWPAGRCQPE